MSDTVTFGNVQVPTADVLAAADRIRGAKPLVIQAGKRYRDRLGRVWGNAGTDGPLYYPWSLTCENGVTATFTRTGAFLAIFPSDSDLIEELPDAPKAEPAPAPVEGMEYRHVVCGALKGAARFQHGRWQRNREIVQTGEWSRWPGWDGYWYDWSEGDKVWAAGDLIPAHEPVVGQCYRWHETTEEELRRHGASLLRFTEAGWYRVYSDGNEARLGADAILAHDVRMKLRVPYNPPEPKAAWVPKVGEWVVCDDPETTNHGKALKVVDCPDELADRAWATRPQTVWRDHGLERPLYNVSGRLRPATDAEIKAATTFEVKEGMILRRKVDGAVICIAGRGAVNQSYATGRYLSGSMAMYVLSIPLSDGRAARADYDILPSYTVEGVTE